MDVSGIPFLCWENWSGQGCIVGASVPRTAQKSWGLRDGAVRGERETGTAGEDNYVADST